MSETIGGVFHFSDKETCDEESYVTNCIFETKEDEKVNMFTCFKDETVSFKLDGYAIIPVDTYRKHNKVLFLLKKAFKVLIKDIKRFLNQLL